MIYLTLAGIDQQAFLNPLSFFVHLPYWKCFGLAKIKGTSLKVHEHGDPDKVKKKRGGNKNWTAQDRCQPEVQPFRMVMKIEDPHACILKCNPFNFGAHDGMVTVLISCQARSCTFPNWGVMSELPFGGKNVELFKDDHEETIEQRRHQPQSKQLAVKMSH